jgi:hypothetical protein
MYTEEEITEVKIEEEATTHLIKEEELEAAHINLKIMKDDQYY